MTVTEAHAHLAAALSAARPHCFVQVSQYALAVLLAQTETHE